MRNKQTVSLPKVFDPKGKYQGGSLLKKNGKVALASFPGCSYNVVVPVELLTETKVASKAAWPFVSLATEPPACLTWLSPGRVGRAVLKTQHVVTNTAIVTRCSDLVEWLLLTTLPVEAFESRLCFLTWMTTFDYLVTTIVLKVSWYRINRNS